jgi:tRNA(adenine34) deaminase
MDRELFERCRELAYQEALEAFQENEIPVGAVLVFRDRIVASAHNSSLKNGDLTEHAEMNVLKKSEALLPRTSLSGASLIVTLEPCLMCLGALLNTHVKDIYFFAKDPTRGAFSHFNVDMNADGLTIHYIPDEACGKILTEFFRKIRKK